MGAQLSLAGVDTTLIARGAHLAAIRQRGLTLILKDGTELVARDVRATDDLGEAGTHDVVILALKAHQIEPLAHEIPLLFERDTVVVTVQNGIPWWYFQRHGGEFDGKHLASLDPRGVLEANIPAERILGAIAHPAVEKRDPGVIRQVEGNRFPVGELDGTESSRAQRVVDQLNRAGLKSYIVTDIRSDIWVKAWGNLSFNPISALTRATLIDICQFPETRALSISMMREAQEIAHRLGITFRHTIEQRIAGAERVGAHRTSMLQDFESGQEPELEALVGVVVELGRLTNTPTPAIDAVYACAKLLWETSPHHGTLKRERSQSRTE
jgi:2-dehydropantoate 2-reductase